MIRQTLEARRKALPLTQRLFVSAIPLSLILQIVPLVLQILAALGIAIPGLGKTADADLDQAMRDGGLI